MLNRILFFFLFISFSCESPPVSKSFQDENNVIGIVTDIDSTVSDSSTLISPTSISSDTINQIDENGLKQGWWKVIGTNQIVLEMMHYENDTLDGIWYGCRGMKKDGVYRKGKKQGLFRTYYSDKDDVELSVMLISSFEADTLLWHACPAADIGYLIPFKGIEPHVDSINVSVPFVNGLIWYKGKFFNGDFVGQHLVYYTNGDLHGVVDYDLKTFVEYGHEGDTIQWGNISAYKGDRRF